MLLLVVLTARLGTWLSAKTRLSVLIGITHALLQACSEPSASKATEDSVPNTAGAGATSALLPAPSPVDTDACLAANSASASPVTVAELNELVNGLPKPTTLPCLLARFERPLQLSASASILSAQPTEDPRSPRFFVFIGPLILSVLPAGKASKVMEIGQLVSERDSLKAELEFPIVGQLDPDAAFDRIFEAPRQGTKCGVCHGNESAAPQYGKHAFVSDAVSPRADSRVALAAARELHEACDAAQEPERCELFSALFDHGEVVETEFPRTVQPLF